MGVVDHVESEGTTSYKVFSQDDEYVSVGSPLDPRESGRRKDSATGSFLYLSERNSFRDLRGNFTPVYYS